MSKSLRAAAYDLGDLAGQGDREKWAHSAIEHLFDEVRDGHNGYAIFGHSAGGQFVQRLAPFRPDSSATAMVAADPGWYAMPEWRKDKASHPYPQPDTAHDGAAMSRIVAQTLYGKR